MKKGELKIKGNKKAINRVVEPEGIYTLLETAELLKMHKRSVYNYVYSGELKAHKVARKWLIYGADIMAFIKAR